MKQLIDAIEALFTTTRESGGELARTAKFALENTDWNPALDRPKPASHHVVDSCLESTCTSSGPVGSNSHNIARTLIAVQDGLEWRTSSKSNDDGLDIAILLHNFAVTTIIGPGAMLPSDKVTAGFSLQARNTYYPPHAHYAEESYFIIGGNADWRVGSKPWFAVEPGDSIYHETEAHHAMQTNQQSLLTIWLWTSHLDSEVMIVRG